MRLDLRNGDGKRKKRIEMKEAVIVNCVSVVAGATAIAVACKITKSAWPLFAFIIVPTFSMNTTVKEDGTDK